MYSLIQNIILDYSSIIRLIEVSESRSFTIKQAIEIIKTLDFGSDQFHLMDYVDARWREHPILLYYKKLINSGNFRELNHFEALPATSCEVERVFSSATNVMTDRRNFSDENLIYYIRAVHENSKQNQ